jgi:DNA-binding NarL/FixJ family response regulator
MRIVIADDHAIVRQGLRALVEKEEDIEVVGEAGDGEQAVALARELEPDVMIMDLTMPKLNGVEAIRIIHSEKPDIRIIALSMHANRQIIKEVLKAGALGYVVKSHVYDELAKALRAVAEGTHYLGPLVADLVVEGYINPVYGSGAGVTDLTGRERQILQMLAEGRTIKQIAVHLHISPKTADASRRRIMVKLGITSMADLVKYAVREGLTSVDF